jgi:nitrogen fixation protein NifU and related proteins
MGKIPDADGFGESEEKCADKMWITIRVEKDSSGVERIAEARFKTFGCAAAIATSSLITEMAKGKTLEEAYAISREQVVAELGGLPPIKKHCSNLAAEALRKAIDDYRKKQNLPPLGEPTKGGEDCEVHPEE